jgi:type II secretory pathway component PulK
MSRSRRGGALLMVLWLSAALSAIAFAVALRVRTELSAPTPTRTGCAPGTWPAARSTAR